jgi:hypothetical protein
MNARWFGLARAASSLACLAVLTCLAGCGGPRVEARPRVEIAPEVAARGERIYVGTVFPLRGGATEPSFVYERRVDERDGAHVSTHITRDPSGATALAESATHTADYALVDYTLHTNQLGQSGTIHVDGDQVTFRLVDGSSERSSVERSSDAVAVGPTLVGFILRHADALKNGAVVPVRMAILDRMETIGFALRAVDAEPGQTRIRMEPSSFVVGLLVDPVYFTFESATGKLVRLEGRVPPKVQVGDRWQDFDARVEYRFVAEGYR